MALKYEGKESIQNTSTGTYVAFNHASELLSEKDLVKAINLADEENIDQLKQAFKDLQEFKIQNDIELDYASIDQWGISPTIK